MTTGSVAGLLDRYPGFPPPRADQPRAPVANRSPHVLVRQREPLGGGVDGAVRV